MEYRISAHHRGVWIAGDRPLTLAGSYEGPTPCVGDWVTVRETQIVAVRPRRTFFSRRAAGDEIANQAIAANVEIAFLVMGLDDDFNLRRLERDLILAIDSRARPVILLTKCDVCPDTENRLIAVGAIASGVSALAISSIRGDGLDSVRSHLSPGATAVLLGSSGAGKSTLLNALLGFERMSANAVRESDSRGRHTTTHRELIELPGGAFLIDTPGMRELQLWVDEEAVASSFSEIEKLSRQCRYADCRHESEPGCAVIAAVERGEIDPARLGNLHKLRKEAQWLAAESDSLLRRARNQKWKSIHKAARMR